MRSTRTGFEVRKMFTREAIERFTLWVFAVGLLITVMLTVAKSAVRDYKDLREEIRRPAATETQAVNQVHNAIPDSRR